MVLLHFGWWAFSEWNLFKEVNMSALLQGLNWISFIYIKQFASFLFAYFCLFFIAFILFHKSRRMKMSKVYKHLVSLESDWGMWARLRVLVPQARILVRTKNWNILTIMITNDPLSAWKRKLKADREAKAQFLLLLPISI